MLSLINWRLKITINDGRAFIGQMLAFDRHMNLVLADCEEFRRVRQKKKPGETEAGPEQEMKRSLGLVILRGETVVSLSVEGPPPVQDEDKKSAVCVTPFFPSSNVPELPSSQTFPFFSASCWARTRDAGRAWNGNGTSRCVLLCLALGIQSGAIVTYCCNNFFIRQAPRPLRGPRCRSRHLACQEHLPASAPPDFRQACLSLLLLGSVALPLPGKTIARTA